MRKLIIIISAISSLLSCNNREDKEVFEEVKKQIEKTETNVKTSKNDSLYLGNWKYHENIGITGIEITKNTDTTYSIYRDSDSQLLTNKAYFRNDTLISLQLANGKYYYYFLKGDTLENVSTYFYSPIKYVR